MDEYVPDDVSAEVFQSYQKKNSEYLRKVGDLKWDKAGRDRKGIQKEVFWPKSNYSMPIGPHTASYDYSFLNRNGCCQVGAGYFENGKSVEPFDMYGQLNGKICANEKNDSERLTYRMKTKEGVANFLYPPFEKCGLFSTICDL